MSEEFNATLLVFNSLQSLILYQQHCIFLMWII